MRVIAAVLVSILLVASARAESGRDYRLRVGTTVIEPMKVLSPRLDGQREALGSGEVAVLCFADGSGHALMLRVDRSFYALNGAGRDLSLGGMIEWRGERIGVVDPYASKLSTANYMQKMIGPSNRACAQGS